MWPHRGAATIPYTLDSPLWIHKEIFGAKSRLCVQ